MGRKHRGAPTAETQGARGAEQQPGAAAAGAGDSPDFTPPQLAELAARGYERRRRHAQLEQAAPPAQAEAQAGVGGAGGAPPRSKSNPSSHAKFSPPRPPVGACEISPPVSPSLPASGLGGGGSGVATAPLEGALLLPGRAGAAAATAEDRALAVIRRADARVERKATRIVDWALGAAQLDDSGAPVDGEVDAATGRPAGWSAVRHNVAKDARRPLKQQPGYLAMSSRIKESYVKAKSGVGPAPQLNAEVVVYVSGDVVNGQVVNNYPRKDITDRER